MRLAATVALLVVWFFAFRPQALGGPVAYELVSGTSMLPTFENGDLVLVREQSSYAAGEVVSYRVPAGDPAEGAHVIHRIVGGSASEGFVLRGDNRTATDLWRPKAADVVGSQWLAIPRVGDAAALLRSPLVLATLAGLLVTAVALGGRGTREREQERTRVRTPTTG
ncbi:MAG: S24/S26 family peptidase [Thermoleophilia bacterium]|nr:S24/S26 family peptidase [Thermoleophilia bacterium]